MPRLAADAGRPAFVVACFVRFAAERFVRRVFVVAIDTSGG
jgi:hypothetical protein